MKPKPARPSHRTAAPTAPTPASAAAAAPGAAPQAAGAAALGAPAAEPPLSEADLGQLQALIDSLPDDRDALDVVMVDGYLCGVLLQPQPVAEADWLPLVMDIDGRAPPASFDVAALRGWLRRRHAELNRAIGARTWFDPWVYQLDDEATPSETVMPWVAGFATAVDHFTGLMDRHEDALLEPLATLYRHLDPDDLEDADELLAEIETYEPAATLAEAVEDLVRSTLLIADVSRPQPVASPRRPPPGRGRPPARPGSFKPRRP